MKKCLLTVSLLFARCAVDRRRGPLPDHRSSADITFRLLQKLANRFDRRTQKAEVFLQPPSGDSAALQ
jgi:hypothetical protein